MKVSVVYVCSLLLFVKVSVVQTVYSFIHLKYLYTVSSQMKNLISRGAVLSNSKSIYNVFTVFYEVPLNQCQAVFKTLLCSMVYLNRLFLNFCDVVAHWICWGSEFHR